MTDLFVPGPNDVDVGDRIEPGTNDPFSIGGFSTNGPHFLNINMIAETVPEPSTFALLGMGAISLLGYAWRWRRQVA